MKTNNYAYELQSGEPGIEILVFLPLKIQYQGFVADTLHTGLTTFSFTAHYNAYGPRIDYLMQRYSSLTRLCPEKLTQLDRYHEDIFKGFSRYAVDGGFRFSELDSVGKNLPKFSEERTEIINMLFLPDFPRIFDDAGQMNGLPKISMDSIIEFTSQFLSMASLRTFDLGRIDQRMAFFLDDPGHLKLMGLTSRAQAMFLHDRLKLWLDAINIAVHGYHIFTYTEKLKTMFESNVVSYLEEEIWSRSHFGISINRVKLTNNN